MTDKSHLLRFGYAPGEYGHGKCADCEQKFYGDKYARRCETCAESLHTQITSVEAVADKHRAMTTLPEEAVKAAQNAIRTTNWEYGITDADMAKALTAALPFLSVQGAVKKLEWELVSGDHYAEGAGTHYNIYETKPGLWNSVMVKPVSVRLATNADLEAAKAAAQADFEARILSAIETGITVSQPSCAKIKAARKAVEELANTPMNLPLEDWSRISSAILSALEPSAARELALEEGYRQGIEAAAQIIETKQEGFQVRGGGRVLIDRSEGDQSGLGYAAAIRALSSPDHADAGHTQARDVLARFRDYVIEGITAGTIMRGGEHHNPIWQEVAGVLHADAGKVEGDGWLPIEIAPKDGTEFLGHDASTKTTHVTFANSNGYFHDPDSHYYSEAPEFNPTHWRPLPSAPSEGEE